MPKCGSDPDASHKDVRDLARGGLVNLVGKIGRLTKTSFVFVVKLLFGPEILGLYELAASVVTTFLRIGTLGLDRGVVRFIAQSRSEGDPVKAEEAIAAAMILGGSASLIVAGGVTLAADHIARFYETPSLALPIRIMSWSIPFITLAFIFLAAAVAVRIMRFDVYVNSIAGPLVLLTGGSIAGLMEWGLRGLAVAQLAMGVVMCIFAAYLIRNSYSLGRCLRRLRGCPPWKRLATFSVPVTVTDLINTTYNRLDYFMLGVYVAPEMIGIYSVSRRISSAILKVPQAFDPIFSAVAADLSTGSRHWELGARFASLSRWVLLVNLPVIAMLQLGGEHLLAVFGQDMSLGVGTMIAFAWGMMLYGLVPSGETLLIMSGRPYLNLVNSITWLALNFVLNLLLIPRYGILGAAVATSVSMNVVNVLRLLEVFACYKFQPFTMSHTKPIIAAIAGFAAAWYVERQLASGSVWEALLSYLCFLSVYFVLLAIQGIEPEDRAILRRAGSRLARLLGGGDAPSRGQ